MKQKAQNFIELFLSSPPTEDLRYFLLNIFLREKNKTQFLLTFLRSGWN